MSDSPEQPKGPEAAAGDIDPQLLQALAQDISMQFAGLLEGQNIELSQEEFGAIVGKLVQEQLFIGQQVMPSFINEKMVQECPRAQILIRSPQGVEANFTVHKRPGEDPIDSLLTALMFSFLISAPVRGLLLARGFRYRFQQIKPPSNIIMPK